MTTDHTTGWVLWAGTVGFARSVFERLDAARHVDVQRFSVTPFDVEHAASAGVSAADLGRRIRDAGYSIVMDPIAGWYPGLPHPQSRLGAYGAEQTLRMSADLGAVAVNLIGHHTHDVQVEEIAQAFGVACDRAGDFGAVAHLEFTPITAITDLATGWDIVRMADRPNGGLLVDTWHFYKGTPDLALLASIPGERVFSVQVADARTTTLPDVRHDTMHRALPGEGTLDLAAVLDVLHRNNALSWVGPEVIAPDLAVMRIDEAVKVSDAATRDLVLRVTSQIRRALPPDPDET